MLLESLWLVPNERPFAQLMPAYRGRPCDCHFAMTVGVATGGIGAQKGRIDMGVLRHSRVRARLRVFISHFRFLSLLIPVSRLLIFECSFLVSQFVQSWVLNYNFSIPTFSVSLAQCPVDMSQLQVLI
jgi:hypothetical protein